VFLLSLKIQLIFNKMKILNVKEIGGTLLVRLCTSVYLVDRFFCFSYSSSSLMFICLINFFGLVIFERCQKNIFKIEIVDRCNFYCTGKLLPIFDMQKWKKKKRNLP